MVEDILDPSSKEQVLAHFGMSEAMLERICAIAGYSRESNEFTSWHSALDFHTTLQHALECIGFDVPDFDHFADINWQPIYQDPFMAHLALEFYGHYEKAKKQCGGDPLVGGNIDEFKYALLAGELSIIGRHMGLEQITQPRVTVEELLSQGRAAHNAAREK